jgi:hypothetical protein
MAFEKFSKYGCSFAVTCGRQVTVPAPEPRGSTIRPPNGRRRRALYSELPGRHNCVPRSDRCLAQALPGCLIALIIYRAICASET